MTQSLRFKILLAMVLVIIAGVVITALNATRITSGEFRRFASQGQMIRRMRFAANLADFYAKERSWKNVQPLVNQLRAMTGERIILANSNRVIVSDSEGTSVGRNAGTDWDFEVLAPDNTTVGYLYISPVPEVDTGMSRYILNVYRSVWVGAAIAILIGFVATLLISSSILKPVEELTAAARKMQNGDLSARVNIAAQDEIGILGNSFNAMADSLAQQEQLRKNMVSDVAHELRTPLANILGYLEAAHDGLIDPDMDLVNNLNEEATLLNRLIDDLQELAQVEAGRLRFDISTVHLDQVIQTAMENFMPACQKMGVTLSSDIPADLPAVHADGQRVAQVLRNLIGNALDYTPPGGTISIQAGKTGEFVRVAVADSGTGIEAEHLPVIFERFYRADPSRTRTGAGHRSGLGLAIVKQLVQAQGGQVGVESKPGSGSTFYFTLPIS